MFHKIIAVRCARTNCVVTSLALTTLGHTHEMIYFFHINRSVGLHFCHGRSRTPGGDGRHYTSQGRGGNINTGSHNMLNIHISNLIQMWLH